MIRWAEAGKQLMLPRVFNRLKRRWVPRLMQYRINNRSSWGWRERALWEGVSVCERELRCICTLVRERNPSSESVYV